MTPISKAVLQQLKTVYEAGVVTTRLKGVQKYALQNGLMALAGWISWNGKYHYQSLANRFDDEFVTLEAFPINLSARQQYKEMIRSKVKKYES